VVVQLGVCYKGGETKDFVFVVAGRTASKVLLLTIQ
jgi:hypothetical protein